MSEAVAPSRAMRSRANRRESSVARGIELDSPSLKSTDLAGLYHVERPRETWCRVTGWHAAGGSPARHRSASLATLGVYGNTSVGLSDWRPTCVTPALESS